ncbi:hypothetical protein JCM15519_26080 [Fundidesulfovibrio butyratiphilus]
MGFAEKWSEVEPPRAQGSTPRSNILTILKIAPKGASEGYSENTENIEHRGSTLSLGQEAVPPIPPTDPSLAALVRFEHDPHGVVAWLAVPKNHVSRDSAHSARWRACIQHEARLRVEEAGQ